MSSLNLDFTQIWNQAVSFTNNMWPIFVIPIGLVLGVGILQFVLKTLKQAIASF